MEHGPGAAIGKKNGGEEDRVEVYIVLAHELEQSDVLWVKPPLLPFGRIVGSNTWVSYRCIELEEEGREDHSARKG